MNIYPSLTSQNHDELATYIKLFEPYVAGFHIDYMDGVFVPHTLGSAALINHIRTLTTKRLWIHCMTIDPYTFMTQLQLQAHDIVTFHIESTTDYQPLFTHLTNNNLVPSIALNPETPLSVLGSMLPLITHITIMSVHPGSSGQTFIPETWQKLALLQELRVGQAHYITLAVDGGITRNHIDKLISYGVTDCALHNAIFDTENPLEALQKIVLESARD